MAHFVLVHGFAATDKSWFDIPVLLENEGHSVDPVLLRGRTMASFVDAVESALSKADRSVLVGHSMGGVSISQAAANHPDKVSKLVYVAALVPGHGESAAKMMLQLGTSLDNVMDEFEHLGIDGSHPARRRPVFEATLGAFSETPAFAAIPKHYVACADDTIVRPPKQAEMIAKWPGTTTTQIASRHIPQKENPDALMDALLRQA